ncbi:MAG: hypothetical protein AB1445_07810 [Bacillota bacterium]
MWLLLPLALGLVVGSARRWDAPALKLSRAAGVVSLLVLLFLMGVRTGADLEVRVGLARVGVRAVAVALGATSASIVAGAWYARCWLEVES